MAEDKSAAVYVSWSTFKNAIESLLDHGVPNHIDRSTFGKLSGGVQGQLLAGLKFLGLIDEDSKPTKFLHELVVDNEEERKTKLRAILKERYAKLFELDLEKTTPDQLSKRIGEAYNVGGDTREKAIRFFLLAATYAEVPISKLFSVSSATVQSRVVRTRRRSSIKSKAEGQSGGNQGEFTSGTSRTINLVSGGVLTLTASLDLFSLTPDDRKFVFDLIDELDGYEKGHVKKVGGDDESGGNESDLV